MEVQHVKRKQFLYFLMILDNKHSLYLDTNINKNHKNCKSHFLKLPLFRFKI